jgi:hypothetical protein
MSVLPESSQWKHEATRLQEFSRIAESNLLPEECFPPDKERVEEQRSEDYDPPGDVKKTATPEEYQTLCEILGEICKVNNEFIGEPTHQVEAYLCTTGANVEIEEKTRNWCQSYFSRRMKKDNGRDKGNPLATFDRLRGEYDRILGHLQRKNNSVNYLLLKQSLLYVTWLLGNNTLDELRKDVGFTAARKYEYLCSWLQEHYCSIADYLTEFLEAVARCANQTTLVRLSRMSDVALKKDLETLASDVQEMRPFLVRGFDPERTLVGVNEDFFLAWDWSTVGMASILCGPTREFVHRWQASRQVLLPIGMGCNGILFDNKKTWISAAAAPLVCGINPMAVNLYVLQLFHERLFFFYDRIDLPAIRRRGEEASEEDLAEDEEVLAESVHRLADEDAAPEVELVPETIEKVRPRRRRLRPLGLRRFLAILEESFGCEVQHGKGSEITVYRRGARKMTLGGHGKNPTVQVKTVKRTLRQLGITLREWLAIAEKHTHTASVSCCAEA